MQTFYVVCAGLGATFLIGQFLLSLVGLGHDGDSFDGHDAGADGGHDVHDGHGSAWFAGVLSVRALTAALSQRERGFC